MTKIIQNINWNETQDIRINNGIYCAYCSESDFILLINNKIKHFSVNIQFYENIIFDQSEDFDIISELYNRKRFSFQVMVTGDPRKNFMTQNNQYMVIKTLGTSNYYDNKFKLYSKAIFDDDENFCKYIENKEILNTIIKQIDYMYDEINNNLSPIITNVMREIIIKLNGL